VIPSDGAGLNPVSISVLNPQFTTGCSCYSGCQVMSCQFFPIAQDHKCTQHHKVGRVKRKFSVSPYIWCACMSALAACQEFLCVYHFIKESKPIK